MSKYKLIIFDLDGTLIHSIEGYAHATNELLRNHGREPVSVDTVMYHLGYGLKKYVYDLFPEETHSESGVAKIAQEFDHAYDRICLEKTSLYPDVREFLKNWPGKSAVVTNKAEHHARKIISHLLPEHEFVSIFGAETLPERKPHPLPLLEAAQRADIPIDQCLMVGDSPPDILASRGAKMAHVAVSYGYTPLQKLQEHAPDAIIDSFGQLKEHL